MIRNKKDFIDFISLKMKEELLFNSEFYKCKAHIDELYYSYIQRQIESTLYTNYKLAIYKTLYSEITSEKSANILSGKDVSSHNIILKVLEYDSNKS